MGTKADGAGLDEHTRFLSHCLYQVFTRTAVMVAGPTWVPEEPVRLVHLLAIFAMGAWSLYQFRPEVQPQAAPTRTRVEDPREALVEQEP